MKRKSVEEENFAFFTIRKLGVAWVYLWKWNWWMTRVGGYSVDLTLRLVSLIYANGGQGNANERVPGGHQPLASLVPPPTGTLSTTRRSLHSSWVQWSLALPRAPSWVGRASQHSTPWLGTTSCDPRQPPLWAGTWKLDDSRVAQDVITSSCQ